jgi:hypothetical protein
LLAPLCELTWADRPGWPWLCSPLLQDPGVLQGRTHAMPAHDHEFEQVTLDRLGVCHTTR